MGFALCLLLHLQLVVHVLCEVLRTLLFSYVLASCALRAEPCVNFCQGKFLLVRE